MAGALQEPVDEALFVWRGATLEACPHTPHRLGCTNMDAFTSLLFVASIHALSSAACSVEDAAFT